MNSASVGLGRLVAIGYHAGGRHFKLRVRGRGWWLLWNGRELEIARELLETVKGRDARAEKAHRLFHGAAPNRLEAFEVIEPTRPRVVGLVEWIEYSKPRRVKSPSKIRAKTWRHWFGDVDDKRTCFRLDKNRPDLVADESGAVAIRRRPGNRYTVKDWIIG